MPHIHTHEGQHDCTVGMYVVRDDGDEPRIYMHMHKKHGVLLQFGGHVELDETPWQAVVHELAEESGYDIEQLELLQPSDRITSLPGTKLHPYPVVLDTHSINDEHSHSNISYAFVTSEDPRGDRAEGESSDLRLYTEEELANLDDDEIIPAVREIGLFVLKQCYPKWERVSTTYFET